mmetsp:Transcript_93984/g.166357  ORF Transcript_93984/g.166357 Transcript_93984/m.166357 type:complete len:307 (-) Transcript_93984:104-1024(-)
MGAACSTVEKGEPHHHHHHHHHNIDELEGDAGEHEEEDEAIHSDPSEVDEDILRKDAIDTLASVGSNLKRGHTMAMREAIYTAKKLNVEPHVVHEAEKQLADHKREQRREEMAAEMSEFFESKEAKVIQSVEKMLKKAVEAECDAPVIRQLEERLEILIVTRPLEHEEGDHAKDYMKQSCQDFVRIATSGGGRPVVFMNMEDGKKISATLTLDAPLQNLLLQVEDRDDMIEVPVASLSARPAKKDSQVAYSRGFRKLDEEDADSAVALRHRNGVWCIIEPTEIRRDRFVEAIVVLVHACNLKKHHH